MFKRLSIKKKKKEDPLIENSSTAVKSVVKDSRPPPPKPSKNSKGIPLHLMNTTVPLDLMPDEESSLKELCGIVSEVSGVSLSYEVVLVILGVCVGKFDDFRKKRFVVDEKTKKEVELSLEIKLSEALKKYNWVAFSDVALSESLRSLLAELVKNKKLSQVEGKDEYVFN